LLANPLTHIYICGSSNQMPKAVRAALAAAAAQHYNYTEEEAAAMLTKMEGERRLQYETW
jgi:sulfite reductase alpha subunit-like flavoprotein